MQSCQRWCDTFLSACAALIGIARHHLERSQKVCLIVTINSMASEHFYTARIWVCVFCCCIHVYVFACLYMCLCV